ncbi:hypothetical protein [Algicella marina]|uniref:hypothetical protein n=1 Tax=Algicella marina TaxID=2683284 RepID=UPI0024DF8BC3|nr:hypothetical protein [Algicella marina]
MHECLERVTFTLVAGTSETDLAAALDTSQQWLMQQPGFNYSSVSREGYTFAHSVYWASRADAEAAAEAFPKSPANAPYLSLIEGGSVKMAHEAIVHSFLAERLAAA